MTSPILVKFEAIATGANRGGWRAYVGERKAPFVGKSFLACQTLAMDYAGNLATSSTPITAKTTTRKSVRRRKGSLAATTA